MNFHEEMPHYLRETQMIMSRIISFDRLCDIAKELRETDKRLVFTSGCFDIVHTAHLHYLQYLKNRGDILAVGIDSDVSTRKLKGQEHPFFHEKDRAMIVSNLRCVDYVCVFDGVWQVEHLIRLNPSYVGVPPFDPNMTSKREKIELSKSQIVITPPLLSNESSSRKAKILKNDYLATNVIIESNNN